MEKSEHAGAGRYAPSPSGDLHLGNLRTALLAWMLARASGRRFLLRIEDLDRGRDAGTAQRQLDDLRRIGIEWDGGAVRQTDRAELYASVFAELEERGLTYECFCSRKDILSAPSAPHAPPGSYPGTCRDLSARQRELAAERIHPRAPSIRLRLEQPHGTIVFTDRLRGETTGDIDDLVLLRGDGAYAYNFAVVVDDADMGIDQVVRGDDLLLSTPRQIALQRILGYPQPEYFHVPLVLGPTGRRLAKRDGAVTLADLGAQGIDAGQVLAMLGASLGLCGADEPVHSEQLLARFTPAQLSTEPWVYRPSGS